MRINDEELRMLRSVNLVDFLKSLGVPMKKKGASIIHAEHDSCYISEHKGWTWYSQDVSGNAIDYLMKGPDFNYSFNKAAEIIREYLGGRGIGTIERNSYKKEEEEHKEIELPQKADNNRRCFAYLHKTRGILPEIINHFVKAGELFEDKKGNAVFLGKDKEGKVKFGFKRGTLSDVKFTRDLPGSDKNYGFKFEAKDPTEIVRVFEAPIDLMSYLTLSKKCGIEPKDRYISLGGVALRCLDRYLQEHPGEVKKILICTDNDEAGKTCAQSIYEKYHGDYIVKLNQPKYTKDWNEELLYRMEKERVPEPALTR